MVVGVHAAWRARRWGKGRVVFGVASSMGMARMSERERENFFSASAKKRPSKSDPLIIDRSRVALSCPFCCPRNYHTPRGQEVHDAIIAKTARDKKFDHSVPIV